MAGRIRVSSYLELVLNSSLEPNIADLRICQTERMIPCSVTKGFPNRFTYTATDFVFIAQMSTLQIVTGLEVPSQ